MRGVYDVPAECCRVDGTDGKSRVDINIIMEDSICKKSSGLHRVREMAPYFPSINLRHKVLGMLFIKANWYVPDYKLSSEGPTLCYLLRDRDNLAHEVIRCCCATVCK